ncbi:MAG: hypothetical protein QOE48_2384 [Mycobacterium sp.]|nr:hypothetical protein [Mycobacterium sp.]
MKMGGCGCRTGLGRLYDGPKSTYLPWYSAGSAVQSALMASMRSSSSAPRVFGSVPWSRNSSIFQPAPTPKTNRPPEIRSMLAASLAVVIGSR